MSDRFVVGDTVTLSNTFAVSGTATDPTTVSLTVTDPTGSSTTYTYAGAAITRTATGVYTKNITASAVGAWGVVWTGTGTAADVALSGFEVYTATPPLPGGWNYSGDPTNSNRDAVRFLIGDTNAADPLVTDGEILYLLGEFGAATSAAAAACRAIAAKFSRQADKTVGDLSISASQRAKAFGARADELDSAVSASLAPIPVVGGVSIADKATVESSTDRVRPSFTKDGFTAPGTDDSAGVNPRY